MRVIAGLARGHRLVVPGSIARPTTDRVREAVFSSLGDLVVGAWVLDLFAGSGALGLEALSRGAASVRFVDASPQAIRAIEENLRRTKLAGGEALRRDALAFLGGVAPESCDLVFADPPYVRDESGAALLEALLSSEALSAGLDPEGLLVLESSAERPLPGEPLDRLWRIQAERRYGKSRVSFLAPRLAGPPPGVD